MISAITKHEYTSFNKQYSTLIKLKIMANFTVKDIKEALKNLDESKEFMIVNSYSCNDKIDIEYVKELKENGKEYYKINI